MASACLNNNVTISPPENFIDVSTFPSYGSWLSPRVSFSRELADGESKLTGAANTAKLPLSTTENVKDLLQFSDLDVSLGNKDVGDFEFRLEEDPVTMLPADELFLDGKLMPLHVSTVRAVETLKSATDSLSPETAKCRRKTDINGTDVAYLFSPKAPRCSSKWKEMLGLKKLYQNSNSNCNNTKATASSNSNSNVKSLKHLLHRSSRYSSSSSDACLNLPLLLKESDSESVSISSRLSLSSSSSGHEHEDLPRLSLDSEKTSINSIFQLKGSTDLNTTNPPRLRLIKPRPGPAPGPGPLIDHPSATMVDRSTMRRVPAESCTVTHNGVTADSPRMNPSGKIVFQSLERSSSSPGSFNGSQHHHKSLKQIRGMERSYSANVRVTPVLNVPVCSSLRGSSKSGGVFGFGQLFSTPQKKENGGGGGSSHGGGSRHRSDRI